jgi:2-pyrone-4,6-dicarboxylate lactonase
MATPGYLPYHPSPSRPRMSLPAGACDGPCHVFGPAVRFPYSCNSSYIQVDAPKEVLLACHRHLGIERSVIVQAICHGTGNRAMLDALASSDGRYRALAILPPDAGRADPARDGCRKGVRGLVQFRTAPEGTTEPRDRRGIVERIAALGWHVVVYFEPDDIDEVGEFIAEVPTP